MAVQTLETIWEVDDTLWAIVEPILLDFGRASVPGGRRRAGEGASTASSFRCEPVVSGTNCPSSLATTPLCIAGLALGRGRRLERIWAVLVEHCDELRGVEWKWQAADGSLGKARFGGSMWDRTPRIGRKTARRRISLSRVKAAR